MKSTLFCLAEERKKKKGRNGTKEKEFTNIIYTALHAFAYIQMYICANANILLPNVIELYRRFHKSENLIDAKPYNHKYTTFVQSKKTQTIIPKRGSKNILYSIIIFMSFGVRMACVTVVANASHRFIENLFVVLE